MNQETYKYLEDKFKKLPDELKYAQIYFNLDMEKRTQKIGYNIPFWPYESVTGLIRDNDYLITDDIQKEIEKELQELKESFDYRVNDYALDLSTKIYSAEDELQNFYGNELTSLFEDYLAINDIQEFHYQNYLDFCYKVNLNPESRIRFIAYDSEYDMYEFMVDVISDMRCERYVIEHNKYLKVFDKNDKQIISRVNKNSYNIELWNLLNKVTKI